jgi:heme-degrading monooxygenase HmoA
MFSVLFEVNPRGEEWDAYLGYAKMLRPELEHIDGFVDNIRYRSLTRDGWLLSLSGWANEKALVRWRTRTRHHEVQEKGREKVLMDYHLRVGQVTRDTQIPPGQVLAEQRLDETEVGEGTTATLIDAPRPADWASQVAPSDAAVSLGLMPEAPGLLAWDVFDAVLSPGDMILLQSWRDHDAADAFADDVRLPAGARLRQVRVVRDYGMYDRRESPQYYPEVNRDPAAQVAQQKNTPGFRAHKTTREVQP